MKHPYIDEFRFRRIVFEFIDFMDKIINFFNPYYITSQEGGDMFPLRDVRPGETGVNGHIEIYTGEWKESMPKYIKTPIVRIVYDNSKWNHYTSDYNHTIAVTISDNPKPLKKHKFKKGELTEEKFHDFMRFVADNKEGLLEMWYNGWFDKEIIFKDEAHVFDWYKFKGGRTK